MESVVNKKKGHEDVSVVSNSRFHNKCRVCRQSTGVNSNCCKLCKSVGDLFCSKNVFAKGNRALLKMIMVVTGLDPGGGGGGDSHMKWTGMLVVSLRGVNFGFWSRLGCSGKMSLIFSRQGLV